MPVNKNALLRYQTIDKCLSNRGRRYTFNELLNEVNNVLFNNGLSKGISIRQLRDDLKFMRSSDGYDAPIETAGNGDQTYYYYDDSKFSINKSPLNQTELEQLKSAIQVIRRFEGSPEFDWIEPLSIKILDRFELDKKPERIVGHDNNIDYTGNRYIQDLFNAITNKRVLNLCYESYKGEKFRYEFHPYYLKEYNNRWFVFGYNKSNDHPQWNIPLDRILELDETNSSYMKDRTNWEEYFEDIIGVTKPDGQVPEEVVLRFSKEFSPYIVTKPLHGSQKRPVEDSVGAVIKIKVILNRELETLLNSFGDKVEVLEPLILRQKMKKISHSLLAKYLD
jgi:predicted DNA-binding transcriptional regulator YafY